MERFLSATDLPKEIQRRIKRSGGEEKRMGSPDQSGERTASCQGVEDKSDRLGTPRWLVKKKDAISVLVSS
jgi:hypothetical protein